MVPAIYGHKKERNMKHIQTFEGFLNEAVNEAVTDAQLKLIAKRFPIGSRVRDLSEWSWRFPEKYVYTVIAHHNSGKLVVKIDDGSPSGFWRDAPYWQMGLDSGAGIPGNTRWAFMDTIDAELDK